MFRFPVNRIVNNGLVLYFDAGIKGSYSGSGSTWSDLASSNDATFINSPTYSGDNGGYIFFNGVNQNATSSNPVTGQQQITVSLWVYPVSASGIFQTMASTGDPSSANTGIFMHQGNDGNYYVSVGVFNVSGEDVAFPYTLNQWANVVLVCNGSNLIGYRNGLSQGSIASSRTLTHGTLTLARGPSGNFFNGRIAKVMMHNRALSSAEINQNFQVERKRFGV